ncbi:flagellar biosynthetic protein FliO [Microbacterium sp. 3J1]|uniref:flagellar biosynthetic protein FliO n=1 Tax=Microbacterium sp. 3J1 TaxID=861269 RepID=UPI000AA24C27|nr:flagellar biosynthetic protein FliO [Microbacterium sp. 3J1]
MDDLLVALRAIVALGAVLGLLLFLSRRLQKSQTRGTSPVSELVPKKLLSLAKRMPSRPTAVPRPRPEKITVVARSGLGGKAQLVVAEFGGIRYVLGVTEQGISVVDTQEAPVLDDEQPQELAPSAEEPPDDIVDRALRSVA